MVSNDIGKKLSSASPRQTVLPAGGSALSGRSGSPSISVDDLPGTWRVDVERCWRGLEMTPTFGAKLLVRDDRKRWRRLGLVVYNDDGPIQAISDLLSALDIGALLR